MKRLYKTAGKVAWRLLILIAGLALLIAGIVMIVTPGPAIVFIPAGLAVLATEFQWARHILHKAKPLIEKARERARAKWAAKSLAGNRASEGPFGEQTALQPDGKALREPSTEAAISVEGSRTQDEASGPRLATQKSVTRS